jgi:hypothetical protein
VAKRGPRYRLMLYTYLLNRWWRTTFILGLALAIQVAGLVILPVLLPQALFLPTSDWGLWMVAGASCLAFLVTIFLAAILKAAYIQPFDRHFRLATPFLRLNISYQRIRRTYTSEFQQFFPLQGLHGWKRELLEPLAGRTVLVVELNTYPVPAWGLRLFLSPYFFPDRTPCLALLVEDWMGLSTSIDTKRGMYAGGSRPTVQQNTSPGLLAGIKNPRK